MKVMKYFAVASLALFAACNNEENPVAPESGNQPVDVVMSVALPGPGTRAAMGELQNTANDQDAASVEKLHVYLVAGEDIVLSKEFTKDTNKVVISAEGYKDLVLEVGKDYKKVAIHTNHTGGTATCTKKAVCDFCGEEYGECASHNYGDEYESDGTYHWKKCQNEGCDATTEKEAHKGGEATTTKRAVCEVCGAEYGDLKKEAPKPADKTTEGKKDDTKPAEKPDKKTVKAKKVVVNKKRIVLKKGKKVKLKVKLKPANATEKVTFKSSNKKVAKVTKNGVVKAVKKGKCKITVKTASGKKAVVKVTVK